MNLFILSEKSITIEASVIKNDAKKNVPKYFFMIYLSRIFSMLEALIV